MAPSRKSLRPSLSTTFAASSSVVAVLPPSRGKLLKVLGVWFGIAAVIGNTIAAGIVAAQRHIAALLPNSRTLYAMSTDGLFLCGCIAGE
jgi:hypothetical protein